MDYEEREPYQATLAFDVLDVDLVIKVAAHTIFSPFFTFFIPLMYKGVGAPWTAHTVYLSSAWFVLMTFIWLIGYVSNKYRNSGISGRLDWGEQIILITGGSSGIGALLAETLAVRHCTVAVLDLNPIESENYNIAFYKCDVSKWEEVESVAKRIKEELGDPTVIVNNAGVVQGKLILDLTEKDVEQSFATNVKAQFNILRAFLPAIVSAGRGHVMTVSSVMGLVGCAQISDYAASKAALVSLHECLRYELDTRYDAPLVRTTLLTPGLIQTPMFSGQKPLSTSSKLPTWLFNFLFPVLPPHTVVKEIIAALDEQESRDISLPFYTRTARLRALCPYWMRDLAQWIIGANWSMLDFKKTTGRRSDEPDTRKKAD